MQHTPPTVLLPPSQRRLRHVELICVRNAGVAFGMTASSGGRPGLTGQHCITTDRRGGVRTRAATTFVPSPRPGGDERGSSSTAELPTTRFRLCDTDNGQRIYESEPQCHTLHPTFLPLPVAVKKWGSPVITLTLLAQHRAADQSDVWLVFFEMRIDLRTLQFHSRELSSFAPLDVSTISVAFKCEDGIFIVPPPVGGSTLPPVPPSWSSPANDDGFDNWDIVDGDSVRDEERRTFPLSQPLTSPDVLALTGSATTLHFAAVVCAEQVAVARSLVTEQLMKQQDTAATKTKEALQRVALSAGDALLTVLETDVAQTRHRVEEKRRKLEERRLRVAEDRANLSMREASWAQPPRRPEHEFETWINECQRSMLKKICELMSVDATHVAGYLIPVSEPESEDHNIALGVVAQCFVAVCRVFFHQPLHPVHLAGSRSYIREHAGDDTQLPLFIATKADRVLFPKAQRLFAEDIAAAAYALHGQRQAEGLPIPVGFQKLLYNQ